MIRLMGIVNATPDSFSDRQGAKPLLSLVARAHELVDAGAAIVDVGGESGRTDREAVPVEEEIARVVPLVERLAADGLTSGHRYTWGFARGKATSHNARKSSRGRALRPTR